MSMAWSIGNAELDTVFKCWNNIFLFLYANHNVTATDMKPLSLIIIINILFVASSSLDNQEHNKSSPDL